MKWFHQKCGVSKEAYAENASVSNKINCESKRCRKCML